MYRVIILSLAQKDIQEAASWYNTKQNGLGIRFMEDVRKKVMFIRQNPLATPIRYDEVRTAILDVFPFMVHYSVDEVKKIIVISAIFHTYRDPQEWEKR
jgi:hypothetical protein